MKTLDKVIKAKELCELNCSDEGHCQDCPYAKQDANGDWSFFCGNCEADALHYLKELRDMTDIPMEYFENGGTSQEIVCPKCHSEFVILPEANNPLTWDELKSMEGKPVWIEDGLKNGEWYIIECFTESGRFIAHDRYADDTVFKAIDMGNMWQAYRKERS